MISELQKIRDYIARMNETMGKENSYEDSRLRYKADAALEIIGIELGLAKLLNHVERDVYTNAKRLADKEQKQ